MSLKEKAENNIVIYTAGCIFTGFMAGFGVSQFFAQSATSASSSDQQCTKQAVWQAAARKDQWLPVEECPVHALEARLTSPGSGTLIQIDPDRPEALRSSFVLSSTRTLAQKSDIGLLFQVRNSPNIHVLFPGFLGGRDGGVYRRDISTDLPFKLVPGMTIDVWGLIVDDKRRVGDLYSSLEQVKQGAPGAYITERVTVQTAAKQ